MFFYQALRAENSQNFLFLKMHIVHNFVIFQVLKVMDEVQTTQINVNSEKYLQHHNVIVYNGEGPVKTEAETVEMVPESGETVLSDNVTDEATNLVVTQGNELVVTPDAVYGTVSDLQKYNENMIAVEHMIKTESGQDLHDNRFQVFIEPNQFASQAHSPQIHQLSTPVFSESSDDSPTKSKLKIKRFFVGVIDKFT